MELEDEDHRSNVGSETGRDNDGEIFEWRNRWQHILFFFSYIMNYSAHSALLLAAGDGSQIEKSYLFLLLVVFLGGPLLFLQNSIGQYTRNTCLFLGEMFPLCCGVGYSMLIIAISEVFIQLFYTSKLIYYTIATICNPSPPWMKCYDVFYKYFSHCFSKEDIDRCFGGEGIRDASCFDLNRSVLSAQIFKEVFVFGRIRIPKIFISSNYFTSESALIAAFCIFNLLTIYTLLLISTRKSLKLLSTPLRTAIALCSGLLMAIGVVLFIQPGIYIGLHELINHFKDIDLLSQNCWTASIIVVVESLRLAEGGHILFGSFMAKSQPDFWRPVILILSFLSIVVLSAIYYHLFLGLLLYRINKDIDDLIAENEENTVFVLFPTFLGILPSASFFSLVFFFVLSMLNFFSLTVKVIVIEKTISIYFNLNKYYVYLRYTVCTIALIIGFIYENNKFAKELNSLQDLQSVASVGIVFVQLIMAVLYGLQNILDDIEFTTKFKPLQYIKIFWVASAFACVYTLAYSINNVNLTIYTAPKVLYMTVLLTPVVLGAVAKFFQMAKRKNLIGLLRPTDRFGPPQLEERIIRVLYNPRLEVKYKKREEVCQHECLLNSNAVKTAIKEEIQLVSHFATAMKLKAKAKHYDLNKISAEFETHRDLMLEAVKKEGIFLHENELFRGSFEENFKE